MDSASGTKLVHIMTAPQSLFYFLCGQVPYVQARGFTIEAISSSGEWLQRFEERDRVPVHAIDMPREINPLGDLLAIARLYRVLRRIRPAIVQSGTPQGGLLGTIAAWLARSPVRIYHIRGLPLMTATGPKRQLLRWTEKLSCRLSHRVLCVSHSIREVAIQEGLCPADKIVVLRGGSGNGVDAHSHFNPAHRPANERNFVRNQLGIPADAPAIGFLGRLVEIKGVVELAEMWATLSRERRDLHLIAVGPFENHDPVPEVVAQSLRAHPRVHLTDYIMDSAPYYAAIDLVVFPTHREGLPNVLLEAAAMELAAVATRVPGCVDVIVDGETGTLVPLGDIDALCNAVRRYLDCGQLRREHGRAARNRVLKEFHQEAIWDALIDEYRSLLRVKGLSVPRVLTDLTEDVSTASSKIGVG
jgi:glycosyltransferase involved in cell wall biosynthesis